MILAIAELAHPSLSLGFACLGEMLWANSWHFEQRRNTEFAGGWACEQRVQGLLKPFPSRVSLGYSQAWSPFLNTGSC